ncbi:hypothetical protein HQO83_22695 [Rhodococcus fascians]|nr:hypothetical protein [Rhodococcus fascians]
MGSSTTHTTPKKSSTHPTTTTTQATPATKNHDNPHDDQHQRQGTALPVRYMAAAPHGRGDGFSYIDGDIVRGTSRR